MGEKMSTPLISVYMLTYNHESYIARAIESVLVQKTKFPFELVIGEDCSTDRTREIVLKYQEKHPNIIRVVTSDENVGMLKNSIRTVGACMGKYIAFCEGDDYWHDSKKLEKQCKYLEMHPECGLVHSDQNRYFEEYGLEIQDFFKTTDNLPPKDFCVFRGWNGYNILTCTVMTRKKLLDKVLLDSNIYSNEKYTGATDIPMFIELSMLSGTHYIDEAMSTYTVRLESASNTQSLPKMASFVRATVNCHLYLARKHNVKSAIDYLTKKCVRTTLSSAFWERNARLARMIKSKLPRSIKSHLLYMGVTNSFLHYPLRLLMIVKWRYFKWQHFRFVRKHCKINETDEMTGQLENV
ncbi:MAG: glycosyltransferase [Planctomycetes bacterium]|nr:glycosyltransferase [Planctomycetota bacterium]